jgi:hypothetical protein
MKKTLSHGVIPAIAFATHALLKLKRIIDCRDPYAKGNLWLVFAAKWPSARPHSQETFGHIDQPTTLREKKSMTVANYNHPLSVQM